MIYDHIIIKLKNAISNQTNAKSIHAKSIIRIDFGTRCFRHVFHESGLSWQTCRRQRISDVAA